MKTINILLLWQVPVGASDAVYLQGRSMSAKEATDIGHFFNTLCMGVINFNVVGRVYESDQRRTGPENDFDKKNVDAFLGEGTLGDFTPDKIIIRGGEDDPSDGSNGGHGILGGNRAVAYATAGFDLVLHEIGHMLGMRHARSIDPNGKVSVYKDPTTIMSHGIGGLNAINRMQFGLDAAAEIIEFNTRETREFTLCPVEMSVHDLRPEESQIAVIKSEGHKEITASIYLDRNHPYSLRKGQGNKLYIHERNSDGKHSYSNWLEPALKPGQSLTLPDGGVISNIAYQDQTVRAKLSYAGSPLVNQVGIHSGLGSVKGNVEPVHTGLWVNPFYHIQGFHVYMRGNNGFVYWYTFNEHDHSWRFYYGNFQPGTNTFPLWTTEGGTYKNPQMARPVSAGTAKLHFTSPNTGVFYYRLEGSGRGSVEIQRYGKETEQHPLNGAWSQNQEDAADGWTFHFSDNRFVGYYFGYGNQEATYSGPIRGSEQRWFVCTGDMEAPGQYPFNISQPRGGLRNNIIKPLKTRNVGYGDLHIIDNNRVSIGYRIEAGRGVVGTHDYELTRII